MITLQADFNHMDADGRLRLDDLRMHRQTPFAEIAAKHESIIFLDGEDMVRGELAHDADLGVDRQRRLVDAGRLAVVPARGRRSPLIASRSHGAPTVPGGRAERSARRPDHGAPLVQDR